MRRIGNLVHFPPMISPVFTIENRDEVGMIFMGGIDKLRT